MNVKDNINTKKTEDEGTMMGTHRKMMKRIGASIQRMITTDGLREMELSTQRISTMIDVMIIEGMMTDIKIHIAAMIMGMADMRIVTGPEDHHAVEIEEDPMIMKTVTVTKVVRMSSLRMTAGQVMDITMNRKMMIDIMSVGLEEEMRVHMDMIAELMTIMSRRDHGVTEEGITLELRVRVQCRSY